MPDLLELSLRFGWTKIFVVMIKYVMGLKLFPCHMGYFSFLWAEEYFFAVSVWPFSTSEILYPEENQGFMNNKKKKKGTWNFNV